jgi:cardiolipin synthase A/B
MQHNGRLLIGAMGLAAGAGLGIGLGVLGSRIVQQLQMPDKSVRRPVRSDYGVEDEQFLRAIGAALPPPLLGGNRVTTLRNGNAIFPAMLAAIGQARRSITFETYIYWSGEIGDRFAHALAERARAGVRCHLLLDGVGSSQIDPALLQRMEKAGVQVRLFHCDPFKISRYNHRTHRKLLVIDGRIGFTGGVGIADEWQGDAQDERHWRDNHYRVEGPVVAQFQSAFADNWLRSRNVLLHDEDFYPPLDEAGDVKCQMFQSSPAEGSESMRLMYLLSLAAARRSVRIAMAYFVPDRVALDALIEARRRGVEVTIIVPGPTIDKQVVREASRACWDELLVAGVKMYEYRRTMYHVKAMIVDDVWTSIGSANFDNRSFRLNDEANLNVYDRDFAAEQVQWFEQDRQAAHRITLRQLRQRSLGTRMTEAAARLIANQL